MPNKKVTIEALDASAWEDFVYEIEDYAYWLKTRAEAFANRLAAEGYRVADMNFQNAVYAGSNDVTCSITSTGSGDTFTATLHANGSTVAFIEFGSGLAFANSYQFEHGFAPGQYGRGQGLNPKGWLYRGEIGANPPFGTEESYKKPGFVHTYGNPPAMAMQEAVHEMERKIAKVAAEVFSDYD